LRWGCREVIYEKSPDGQTYVKGLRISKVSFISLRVRVLLSVVTARSYKDDIQYCKPKPFLALILTNFYISAF
jgi:hypothetical protein